MWLTLGLIPGKDIVATSMMVDEDVVYLTPSTFYRILDRYGLLYGWKRPEPFSIKARDGKTDVYGVLLRPSTLDPSKKYPVVENIYTGPHGFMTPKSFRPLQRSQDVAELGFVTVIIDGLGTGKRSRAFH